MKRQTTILRRLTLSLMAASALAFAPGFAGQARALGVPDPSPLSQFLDLLCKATNDPFHCKLWEILDPPGGISGVGFEMYYDPAKIQIDVADSGFLCDFSDGGSCPANAPDTVSEIFSPLVVGGPLPGTDYSLTVGSDIVTLAYDLSANPPPAGSDRNFFALAFTLVAPEDLSDIQFDSQPNTGDMYQIAGPAQYCTLVDGGQCGSDNPSEGFTFATPEPPSLLLVGVGLIGLSLISRRLVKSDPVLRVSAR